ncbi:uncharacterized protein [Temnothorax nylanderi]|uniref:uncharacterized protein isoform X2 n=1 Tax=Temnothorax nylanderi TaxID=102681 RepID=UPI003A8890D5
MEVNDCSDVGDASIGAVRHRCSRCRVVAVWTVSKRSSEPQGSMENAKRRRTGGEMVHKSEPHREKVTEEVGENRHGFNEEKSTWVAKIPTASTGQKTCLRH